MLDFMRIGVKTEKKSTIIYPIFVINNRMEDLMIRGNDFYAIWVDERGYWSTDEQDAVDLIDKELQAYYDKYKDSLNGNVEVSYMWNSRSGVIDQWHKYVQKQCRDKYKSLDNNIIFSNTPITRETYASKALNYPLAKGSTKCWDKLVSSLYSPTEKHKIEWCIGSIVNGDSKKNQKFAVLYGSAGTGKSTVLNIIQDLFDGYYSAFDAKSLGQVSNSFALEAFKNNPLIAIQHDGDLSRIEDNTRLNSIVSHELMTVNEKFKSAYTNRFESFLFMGTNKPVKITEAKSGLLRRLIDISPTGDKIPVDEYNELMDGIKFELGAIAWKCKDVYESNPHYYDSYIPVGMMESTNDFFNFVLDHYSIFKREDGVTLAAAWEMYKTYIADTMQTYALPKRLFKDELRNYFREYIENPTRINDVVVRNYYKGFKTEKFDKTSEPVEIKSKHKILELNETTSILDGLLADCPAQYANQEENPSKRWDNVQTKLSDLDTHKLHYVRVPLNHIVIDFDLKDEFGKKSRERNLEAAARWPETYAEFSKGGSGVHLHYIYGGDPERLSRIYDEDIEVKVFTGKSSLRRRFSLCNNLPIATIDSGLPLKEEAKMVNFDTIKNEKALRTIILRNLNKEYHSATKPSMDFIFKVLNDAYNAKISYDVTDMIPAIYAFAANSTHNAEYCLALMDKMKFKSDDIEIDRAVAEVPEAPITFYDIEVYPNLFLVCWKYMGTNKITRMFNPTSEQIEELIKNRLVGFNCRRYDNHILYARLMGYTIEELYTLSKRIVDGSKNCFFSEAYNLSYTDIYDFASASNKKSLKKLEVEMGIHHQEMGIPWDQPVPEDQWELVAEYCDNDVKATEAAFDYLQSDWMARLILSDVAGMIPNSSTNSLTTKIIFDGNRTPQDEFHYRDLSKPVHEIDVNWDEDLIGYLKEACPEMMSQTHGDDESMLPYFPGYKFDHGKSTYRGEEVGEGGYVYSEPGMYTNVALLDVASMHPHSLMAEALFGVRYTRRFREIVLGRIYIKHEDWDKAEKILDGKLKPFIDKLRSMDDVERKAQGKNLANALKTAINSVYGLTSAKFENPFRDIRNIDNIVAKRGALFMIDLKHAVQEKGFTVAHIKTDSIKIPNATPEIIQFVMDFGKKYGYTFEHEATYERMCLVNDAVYIAKYDNGEWTATGTQFAVPYVFKKLFSGEKIEFDDMCEVKSVTSSLYLDMNEKLPEGEHSYQFIGKVGQFCPVVEGAGGGILLREAKNKDGETTYANATGTKGYRWLESELVRNMHIEDKVDRSYYDRLADEAIATISKYGDFEWFISEDKVPPFTAPDNGENEPPWDENYIIK